MILKIELTTQELEHIKAEKSRRSNFAFYSALFGINLMFDFADAVTDQFDIYISGEGDEANARDFIIADDVTLSQTTEIKFKGESK